MRFRNFCRTFVLLTWAVFSFGPAAVQASPSIPFPSYEEYVRLSPDQKQVLLRSYIDLLIAYEDALPQKFASANTLPRFAELRARIEKLLSEAIVASAHASPQAPGQTSGGSDCYIAGWPSHRVEGSCVEPNTDAYRTAKAKCRANEPYPCNPILFGTKNGIPACVAIGPHGSESNLNVTERCDQKAQKDLGYETAELSSTDYQNLSDQVASIAKAVESPPCTYGNACGRLKAGLDLMKDRLNGLGAGTVQNKTQVAGNELLGLQVASAATQAKNPMSLVVTGKLSMDGQTGESVIVYRDKASGKNFVGPGCGNESGLPCKPVESLRVGQPTGPASSQDIQEAMAENMKIKGAKELMADRSPAPVSPPDKSTELAQTQPGPLERESDKYRAADQLEKSGDCAYSEQIDGEMLDCDQTTRTIDTANTTREITQATGALGIGIAGGLAQGKAVQAGGKQSVVHEESAKLQTRTGLMQSAAAAMNLFFWRKQHNRQKAHEQNAKELETAGAGGNLTINQGRMDGTGREEGEHGYVTSKNKLTSKIVENFYMNDEIGQDLQAVTATEAAARAEQIKIRESNAKDKEKYIAKEVRKVGSKAHEEQMAMAKKAKSEKGVSLIYGVTQLLQAGFNFQAAHDSRELAEDARKLENTGAPLPSFGSDFESDPVAPRQAQAISSSNSPQGSAMEEDERYGEDDVAGLGDPFNPGGLGDDLAAPAPPAAQFKPGEGPGGAAGSGGGGLAGGGSTSPATDGGDAVGPQYAEGTNNPSGYASTGALTPGRRGGGSAGGGGNLDLSGLLAKFLPQEEDDPAGSGILDFGGRTPAQNQPDSLLDRSANIFERIHQTYQKKAKRGSIGK